MRVVDVVVVDACNALHCTAQANVPNPLSLPVPYAPIHLQPDPSQADVHSCSALEFLRRHYAQKAAQQVDPSLVRSLTAKVADRLEVALAEQSRRKVGKHHRSKDLARLRSSCLYYLFRALFVVKGFLECLLQHRSDQTFFKPNVSKSPTVELDSYPKNGQASWPMLIQQRRSRAV